MIIFLIGFMGSGKSTLGRRLARRLNYSFVDMDEHIETREGYSISELFAAKGEQWFRERERDFIEELEASGNMIIATGGGTPCYGDNMELLNQKGVTVYLKISAANLASRLEPARSHRPLLSGLKAEELLPFIDARLKEREPWYNKAQCIIRADNVKPSHVITLVFGADDYTEAMQEEERDDEV